MIGPRALPISRMLNVSRIGSRTTYFVHQPYLSGSTACPSLLAPSTTIAISSSAPLMQSASTPYRVARTLPQLPLPLPLPLPWSQLGRDNVRQRAAAAGATRAIERSRGVCAPTFLVEAGKSGKKGFGRGEGSGVRAAVGAVGEAT